jgi:putative NADPH-quinone reductase
MRVLLVVAYPLDGSLCMHLAQTIEQQLRSFGHTVERLDLYREQFDPVLSPTERSNYYGDSSAEPSLVTYQDQLRQAEALVLVFPTWWFSMPALLKGWIDRIWSPGVAFEHGTPIKPLLTSLRTCLAVTTLGSPWWVDWLIMWRPVSRVLRRGILLACAPQAKFRLLSLHSAENVSAKALAAFEKKIARQMGFWRSGGV